MSSIMHTKSVARVVRACNTNRVCILSIQYLVCMVICMHT